VKDVSGTELAGADALAALKAGAVGASYVQSPFWQQIEKEGYARLIPGSGFSLASYIMETNFMKTQPDVARAILRALLRTQRTYLQGDYHANDLVVEALSKATSSPVETIKATPAMIWNTDLQPTPTMLRNIAEAQADWLEVGGVLQYTDPLPMDRINDLSIVNEVIAGK
jgi:NitT/TauT family transport system substrate-binding protein